MRKLCLILTVLYAFGANCSAQSLNIAENLLDSKSSTFNYDNDWGNWENQGSHCGRFLEPKGGPDGSQCARLTPQDNATYDYNAQLKYNFAATQGTTYVFRLKAKKVSGNGTIQAIMQHNSGQFEQQYFFNKAVSESWAIYEGEVTVTRSDYDVIIINYGKCGEVWIDDIEFGVKADNVTGSILVEGLTLQAPDAMNVGTNAQCIVTITPDNATNKNVTWVSSAPSIIEVDQNGKLTAKSTGTATITVSSQDGGQQVSKEIKVNASTSTNGTVVDGGMFYMVQDFGNATVGTTWRVINNDSNIKEHGSATIVADPARQKGNVLQYVAANNDKTEFLVFHCTLPSEARLSDYKKLVFDYKMGPEEGNYKDFKIYWTGWSGTNYPTFSSGNEQGAGCPWHTAQISLAGLPTPNSNEFDIYIGGIASNKLQLYLSNVRLGIGDYNQNDFSNTWSKVESETLYVTGSGPMPDFINDVKQPWREKNNSITKVIVSENITAIGKNAFKDLTKDNVVIILKSIPDKFGDNCFSDGSHSRSLQLELHDAEKPYISKEVASSNFPTFDKATYFREVKSNYSTVCLPFPISADEVSKKNAKLYDFTSMGMTTVGGEVQYTLEFNGHTGEMEAGQPYLIGTGDMELSNINVGSSAFKLTPTKVTKRVENPDVSITMEGVFQPVVIATGYAYGFLGGKFYMNGGNMSVRPMRASFNGSQLYSAPVQGEQQQSGAKKMPKMFNFEIVPDNVTNISSPAFIAEDFNIEEVYSPSGMKTESLNKGLNIIRTSTGRVLKVMVK